jgi:hypothetical protein
MKTFRDIPADAAEDNAGGSYVYSPLTFDLEMSDDGVIWTNALRRVEPAVPGGNPWRTDGQTFGPFLVPGCGNCTSAPCNPIDTFDPYAELCNVMLGGNCDVDIDECVSEPCQNDAACATDGPNSYTCTCATGFAGHNCNELIDPCFEEENDCSEFATCEHTGPGAHTCTCFEGYSEANGTSVIDRIGRGVEQVCEDVDECASNPCDNGALCLQSS